MGRGIQWIGDAWDEYCRWQKLDKSAVKRINALIGDMRREGGAYRSGQGRRAFFLTRNASCANPASGASDRESE